MLYYNSIPSARRIKILGWPGTKPEPECANLSSSSSHPACLHIDFTFEPLRLDHRRHHHHHLPPPPTTADIIIIISFTFQTIIIIVSNPQHHTAITDPIPPDFLLHHYHYQPHTPPCHHQPSPLHTTRTDTGAVTSLCTSKGLWCDRSLGTQCLGTAVSHTYRPTVPYHQDTVVVPRLFGWWCMTTGGYVAPTWPIFQPRNPTLPHASPHYSEHPTRGGHAPTCGTRALIHPASSSIPTSFHRPQSKLPPILRQDPHTISDIHHHHVVS